MFHVKHFWFAGCFKIIKQHFIISEILSFLLGLTNMLMISLNVSRETFF